VKKNASGTLRPIALASVARRWLAPALIGAFFTLLAVPAVILNIQSVGGLANDMNTGHLPQINYFIQNPFDFVNDQSHVTSLPGHHILLAWWSRILGYGAVDSYTLPVRLLHTAFGIVYAVSLFELLRLMMRRGGHPDKLPGSLALWIVAGPTYYILLSAIYISTDLPGLLIYLGLLVLVIVESQSIMAMTICASVLVFWRQTYAPAIALPFAAEPRRFISQWIVVALVPAAIVLTYLVAWGGLVPQRTRADTPAGVFPHSLLHIIALLGLFTPPFVLLLAERLSHGWRSRTTILAAGAAILVVLAAWVVEPTSENHAAGRWGSIIWTFGRYGPNWHDRSLLILALALVGAVFVGGLAELARYDRDNRIVLLGMGLCLSMLVIVGPAFQRYPEPLLLVSLSLVTAHSVEMTSWRVPVLAGSFGFYNLIGLAHLYGLA